MGVKIAGRQSRQSRQSRWARRGFTLIEMLVAAVLVAVGVVGVFGGIRALDLAQAKAKTAQRLQELAMGKMNELGPVTDPTTADTSGTFSDQGYPEDTWTIDIENTDTENLEKITVTAVEGTEQQSLTTLLYVPSATSTSTTGTTAGGTTP